MHFQWSLNAPIQVKLPLPPESVELGNLLIVFLSEDACCGRPRSWTETVLGKCSAWKGEKGLLFRGVILCDGQNPAPPLTWWVSHVFLVHRNPSSIIENRWSFGKWDLKLRPPILFSCFAFGSAFSWRSWHNEICASHKFVQLRRSSISNLNHPLKNRQWRPVAWIAVTLPKPSTARLPVYGQFLKGWGGLSLRKLLARRCSRPLIWLVLSTEFGNATPLVLIWHIVKSYQCRRLIQLIHWFLRSQPVNWGISWCINSDFQLLDWACFTQQFWVLRATQHGRRLWPHPQRFLGHPKTDGRNCHVTEC